MHGILAFFSGILFFYAFQYFPYVTGFLGIVSFAALFVRGKPLLVLVMVFAAAYAFLRCQPVSDIPSAQETAAIQCVFETYPQKTTHGFNRQTARIESAINQSTGDSISELTGRNVLIVAEREFALGMEYELVVTILKSGQRLNPGSHVNDTPYAILIAVNNEVARNPTVYTMLQEWRYRIHTVITEHFQEDSGALLAAITIGQRSHLSERLRGAFNDAGLAHILSISGTHFGLFSVFLFAIFRMVIRVLPNALLQRMTLYLTPAQAAAFLSFPFMVAYLGLSGGSIPAIRSFIMIGIFLFGLIIGRKGFWLNSLLFAAFIIVLWEPQSMLSLSFQLSFLVVLSIGFTIGRSDTGQGEGSSGDISGIWSC